MLSKYVYFTEGTYVGYTPPTTDYELWVVTDPVSSTTLTETLEISQKLYLSGILNLAQQLAAQGVDSFTFPIKEYLLDLERDISLIFGNLTTSTLTTSSNSLGETAILS